VANKTSDAVWEEVPRIVEPVFGIDERPDSWLETLLYGWQHTLVDISPFVLPLAVAAAIGMSPDDEASLINFGLFSMGVATLIQTTIGNRLPIIQGPSATLTGTLAPVASQLGPGAMWGAAFAGGVTEMIFGASRALTLLRRFFPPAVAGVVVLTIALALGQVAVRLTVGDGQVLNFVLAGTVLALVALFQLRLKNVFGGILSRGAIFVSIWVVGIGLAGQPVSVGRPGLRLELRRRGIPRGSGRLLRVDGGVAGRLRGHLRGRRRALYGAPHESRHLRRGPGQRARGGARRITLHELHTERRHHRGDPGGQPHGRSGGGLDPRSLRPQPQVRGTPRGDATRGLGRRVRAGRRPTTS
jgi:hypothetical protein